MSDANKTIKKIIVARSYKNEEDVVPTSIPQKRKVDVMHNPTGI